MARFLQSKYDFPLTVSLGNKAPEWGLSRWGGDSGLRFIPPDDEGFTLRGDTRRLVYNGLRRSHRFTILADGAFEYDVILNKEPDSNVVVLPMEGAERYDFYRQPDFLKDPYIAGSYAVYKKETLVGEGTGKLCHIHRPEIIDARGRRCWGELSLAGNCLCITIPEQWLADAKYPVVVDPTIGTTTIGSQNTYFDLGEETDVVYELEIPVNRFLVPETITEACTAYIYTDQDDHYAGGRPVFYSDSNNKPRYRKSKNEALIDFRITETKPKGWRSGQFDALEPITNGSYIWFGVFVEYMWYPRFDYGARCYSDWWEDDAVIPDEFRANYYDDYKLSMYFTYTSAQNYVRKITQGVTLADTKKLAGIYKRTVEQKAVSVGNAKSNFSFVRSLFETVVPLETIHKKVSFCRNILLEIRGSAEVEKRGDYYREHIEIVKTTGVVARGLLLFIRIVTGVFARDYIFGRFLKAREELKLKSCMTRELVLNSKII